MSNTGLSAPPALAIWILRRFCPGDTEALAGDIAEQFHEGKTRGWVWNQVLIATAVGIAGAAWRHWPHVTYAIAGTAMPAFLWKLASGIPFALDWWALPWPLSQILLDSGSTIALALAALPVLAAGLWMTGDLRWMGVFRTGVLNLALITVGHTVFDLLAPWLLRPVPGDPYHKFLIIPRPLVLFLFFSCFLVAAWLSCRPSQRNEDIHREIV